MSDNQELITIQVTPADLELLEKVRSISGKGCRVVGITENQYELIIGTNSMDFFKPGKRRKMFIESDGYSVTMFDLDMQQARHFKIKA